METYDFIDDLYQISKKYHTFVNLSKLFFYMFFIAHYIACLFHTIGKISYSYDGQCWMNKFSIVNADWLIRYMYSLYFILITMFTIGYGDITPASSMEIVFVMVVLFIGCIKIFNFY
jgi:hypothetical protein